MTWIVLFFFLRGSLTRATGIISKRVETLNWFKSFRKFRRGFFFLSVFKTFCLSVAPNVRSRTCVPSHLVGICTYSVCRHCISGQGGEGTRKDTSIFFFPFSRETSFLCVCVVRRKLWRFPLYSSLTLWRVWIKFFFSEQKNKAD